ncbi:Ribonuclease H-like superfamily protein [Rhynchospora pubera]|uniref:Ribonuclease H-like superfamily protein n=1 Tax=Rhynchospora pubera TaxID=906938 RepID=A0AAV8D733_9POAL|nr:Ribonuclease H-like superfamily protein [Rhynchospora pubera]
MLWKLACGDYDDRIWVKIIKAKYLSKSPLWLVNVPTSCTKIWRAILQMRVTLKHHVTWQLGKGDKCHVYGEPWHDFWLSFLPANRASKNMLISDLTSQDHNRWDTEKMVQVLGFHEALFIACKYPKPPCNPNNSDRLIFMASQNGKFTYKIATKLLQGNATPLNQQASCILKVIWHTPGLMPRIRLFLWKLLFNSVPTQAMYAHRLNRSIPSCLLCNNHPDELHHALFTCHVARAFWFSSSLGLQTTDLPTDITQLLYVVCNSLQGDAFISFSCHIWALWKHRCAATHDGKEFSIPNALNLAVSYISLIKSAGAMHSPRVLRRIWSPMKEVATTDSYTCWIDGSFSAPNQGGWAYILMKGQTLIQYAAEYGQIDSAFTGELKVISMAFRDVL